MKKYFVLISILICFIFSNCVFAAGYIPRKLTFIKEYGIGLLYAPKMMILYKKPDEKSKIVEIIKWDVNGAQPAYSKLKTSDIFIAFIPRKNIAIATVDDDILINKQLWCHVIYDQENNKSGWVKLSEDSKFYTWHDFLNRVGRMKGMYFWRDMPEAAKYLKSSPTQEAQIVSKFKNVEMVNLQFLRGNWALVKVHESSTYKPVGWIKWRSIDGDVFLFPDLSK